MVSQKSLSQMVEFNRKRGILKTDIAMIRGIELEPIPKSRNGIKQGMALVSRDWNVIYFLRERIGWDDECYFDYAERLIKDVQEKNRQNHLV